MSESITELANIWSGIKAKLSENVEDRRLFDAFLNESSIYSYSGNQMVISVGSKFAAQILTTKYTEQIQNAAKAVLETNIKMKFVHSEELKSSNKNEPVVEKQTFFKNSVVNTALTFDNFVTGPCNLEAKQAAMLITSNPGKAFNPLFIYSNPGLGKTHLMQAIVNEIRESHPGKKALYLEAGDFIQEFIDFVTGEKQKDELQKYICSFDIVLIDDIQGLATKEQTCYFFFEIFNRLYARNKQIVITSDKHPQDLKGYFEERLKSRFVQGLTLSIKQPDVQTCVSILKTKINNGALDLSAFDNDVLEFIASKFTKNIRDIDQALNKLVFYATIYKPTKHIDMEIAMEALQSLIDIKDAKQKLSEQRIINTVAEYYSLTPSQLIGPSRNGNIALARHIAMYLIRTLLDIPYTRIGVMFGGKDHSTVMNGVEKVENSLKTNISLQTAVSELKTLLKS